MSGGSLNYLFNAEPTELFSRVDDLRTVEYLLLSLGYKDIAKDVRRLIEYVLSAENRIIVLNEQLEDVFYSVEWYMSADIGKESLLTTLESYRKGGYGNEADTV